MDFIKRLMVDDPMRDTEDGTKSPECTLRLSGVRSL